MTPQQIADRLRPDWGKILVFMASRNEERDGALSAPEIGVEMWKRRIIRPSNEATWASPRLKRLEARGLVRKLGVSQTGGRCWSLTDLGRTVASLLSDGRAK